MKRLRQSVSAAGPGPEGIRLKRLMEVISKCCRDCWGVKVSRQSGSVHSTQSVQSALYRKSLLINLMPLAEPCGRLKCVAETSRRSVSEQLALLRVGSELLNKVLSLHSSYSVQHRFMFHVLHLITLHNSIHRRTDFSILLFTSGTNR